MLGIIEGDGVMKDAMCCEQIQQESVGGERVQGYTCKDAALLAY